MSVAQPGLRGPCGDLSHSFARDGLTARLGASRFRDLRCGAKWDTLVGSKATVMKSILDDIQEGLLRTDHRNVRRTHCPKGHEYTVENTYWWRNERGRNVQKCKECKRIARQKAKAR